MTLETFEGPWEEIQTHIPEFVGHRVRVTLLDDAPEGRPFDQHGTLGKLSTDEAEKRIQAFEELLSDPFKDVPPLSDYAVSRESMYDDERL